MNLVVLMPIGAAAALIFAYLRSRTVLSESEGTEHMQKISAAIRSGANAYLKRQYTGVAKFFAVVFVVMMVLSFMGQMEIWVPIAFVTGGFFSALSGYVGMKIATLANARTANAASDSLNHGLKVAFSAGSVMGFTVVGLGLLDMSLWFYFLKYVVYAGLPAAEQATAISALMLTFGMGASMMALFARVGGGIFTKAADVGADLVGKVEAGIPEDDPRNPAVIADNVGDNVGDVAGMGADLYESYAGARLSACAHAVSAGFGMAGMAVPMVLCAIGIFASIIGTFFVKTGEEASQRSLLGSLRKGTYISSVIVIIGSYFLIDYVFGGQQMGLFWSIVAGLVGGNAIGYFTEYYTSDTYKPTQRLAESSNTGSATIIISGISLGMMSTAIPVIIVGIVV
ncbi:MAG: sodium/proton-translocating pyrophosphatase, partial [Oscillospiraceae bacterium]|nr:sodium/proton-translocating pyrophosphatase [Oscillospiraceae bacterium]